MSALRDVWFHICCTLIHCPAVYSDVCIYLPPRGSRVSSRPLLPPNMLEFDCTSHSAVLMCIYTHLSLMFMKATWLGLFSKKYCEDKIQCNCIYIYIYSELIFCRPLTNWHAGTFAKYSKGLILSRSYYLWIPLPIRLNYPPDYLINYLLRLQ